MLMLASVWSAATGDASVDATATADTPVDTTILPQLLSKLGNKKAKLQVWESGQGQDAATVAAPNPKLAQLQTEILSLELQVKNLIAQANPGQDADALLQQEIAKLSKEMAIKKFAEEKKLETQQQMNEIKLRLKNEKTTLTAAEKQQLKIQKLELELATQKAVADFASKDEL